MWETIHGTKDLIVSFDGMCIFRNRGMDASWTTHGGWFHTDRPINGPNGLERGYVQGFVNLVRTSPEGGGNVVVPDSHLQYATLAAQFQATKDGKSLGYLDNEKMKTENPGLFSQSVYVHMEAGESDASLLICGQQPSSAV